VRRMGVRFLAFSRLERVQYEDLSKNYEAGLGRVLARLGVVAPLSEIPEATRDQNLAGSSDHLGGAEEVTVLSQTAPPEQKATPPTLKKRVFACVMIITLIVPTLVALVLYPRLALEIWREIEQIVVKIVTHIR
jgi:hypothetical protein